MFAFQVLRPKSNIFSTEIEKNLYTQLYLQVLCCGTREKQQFWISKTQSFHTKFSQTNKQQQQKNKQTNTNGRVSHDRTVLPTAQRPTYIGASSIEAVNRPHF